MLSIYDRIEWLLDNGADITPFIEMLDDMDGDTDVESIDEREPDYDGTWNPWGDIRVEFMGPYVRECSYCGKRHECC